MFRLERKDLRKNGFRLGINIVKPDEMTEKEIAVFIPLFLPIPFLWRSFEKTCFYFGFKVPCICFYRYKSKVSDIFEWNLGFR